ncbi:MAG: hypothetical protein AAF959_18485 [Cyanobacteria bacterium P01_D01_bin.56]
MGIIAVELVFFNPLLGIAIPVVIGLLSFLGVAWYRRRNKKSQKKSSQTIQRVIVANVVLVLGTLYLVILRVPLWLGVTVSRPFFDQYVSNPPQTTALTDTKQQISTWRSSGTTGRLTLNQQIGIYGVSQIAIDTNGGTYFVTDSQGFISTHTLYGIAYRPQQQTPFGHENYYSRRILGDWHEFRVVDERSGR